MDVSKRFWDGERKFFEKIKGECKVPCVISWFLMNQVPSQHLLEIAQTSFTFKNSEKVVKSGCFKKLFRWSAPIFFRNEGGI